LRRARLALLPLRPCSIMDKIKSIEDEVRALRCSSGGG
jgi:hypothetical protein